MSEDFFRRPILNSPYDYPAKHWELDSSGQPTQNVAASRRRADFITPIPKPKKRKASQGELHLEDEKGLSTAKQQYDLTSIINQVRGAVDAWRKLPEGSWAVTPETARLLKHWRLHDFGGGVRPFFCQQSR
jgi:type III restriction enzyme